MQELRGEALAAAVECGQDDGDGAGEIRVVVRGSTTDRESDLG